MSISRDLKNYLEEENIDYDVIEHEPAFTAQETANAGHVSGKQTLKSVIIVSDGKFIMCVLPAMDKVNFARVQNLLGARDVHLANEDDLRQLFPQYDLGCEPPFTALTAMTIFCDNSLRNVDTIYFNGGDHKHLIKMKGSDYLRLAKPRFGDIGFS